MSSRSAASLAGKYAGQALTGVCVGVALHDTVYGIAFSDDRKNTPILVEKWSLLFRGPEVSIRKNDEIVAIDPFDPSRKIVRKVAALTDEYVKLYNGSFVYNAKVEDGCFFVTDEENGGMMLSTGLILGKVVYYSKREPKT